MADEAIIVDVPAVGKVEMVGRGPWHVHQNGHASYDIRDADRRPAAPTVTMRAAGIYKAHHGVVFNNKSHMNAIVTAANAALAEREAAKVSKTK